MSCIPLSVVDNKPLPFSSFTNKLNLFSGIQKMYGSSPEELEKMVMIALKDEKRSVAKSGNANSA